MEKFFEDPNSITEDEILAALRAAVIEHENRSDALWFFIQKQRSSDYA
jgi:hypothetical protein